MSFQIPDNERRFIQSNKSDIFGNLFSTFGVDFDVAKGKVRASARTRQSTRSSDDADLGLPLAFKRTSADGTDRWWALCTGVLFNTAGTDSTAAWTQDASVSTPTGLSAISADMEVFAGSLFVSGSTNIWRNSSGWTASWWTGTLGQPALTASIAHPLHTTKKTNTFMIGDGNVIHTVNVDPSGTFTIGNSRLRLPNEFQVIWIRSNYDGVWIGARNTIGGQAEAFFWDERSENYTFGFKLKSEMTFAGEIFEGILYTINGEGQLLKYNGAGFEEVAVFPVFEVFNKILDDGNLVKRCVQRNGMAVIDGKLHINIGSLINNSMGDSMENFPGGIWTYDPDEGLRHKYSFSQYDGIVNDYGNFICGATGALVATDVVSLFLAGATVFTTASVSITAPFYAEATDFTALRGHFVSSLLEASSFEDTFQDLLLSFKRFASANDRIIVKYKTLKNPNYPIGFSTGTWTSTTVFTTTSVNVGSLANIAAGDEVMIIRGTGAGATARISTVTEAGGTYTITLAEAITGASGTMVYVVLDYLEAATVSTQGIDRQGFNLDAVGTFLQLKVELRSNSANAGSPELEKLRVTNKAEHET